eukprot:scaffold1595_cov171-Amphora_coffeaeformis.AAC.16
MTSCTTNYELQDENKPVYTVLVYSFWGWLSPTPPAEPNFSRGLPVGAPIDPLVWGGLYAESFEGLQAFERAQWTMLLYINGFFLISGLLPSSRIGDAVLLVIGIALFALGILLHSLCVHKLKKDMKKVEESINPTFAPTGYHVIFQPGDSSYSTNLRFAIFFKPKGPSVLDVLPRPEAPLPSEPVRVYMHAPFYRHFILWKCDWKHHDFFDDKQPKALRSIHPFLFGSLANAFHSHEMEGMRKKRAFLVGTLVFLAIFSFYTIRDNRPWWIPVSILIGLAVVVFFYFEHLLTKTSINFGHDQWMQSLHTWQRVMEPLGWHLEYHHKDERSEALRTKMLFGGAPSDFIAFVPIHAQG